MCGILAIIGSSQTESKIDALSKRMSHRGPDESDLHVTKSGAILSHERLAIMDINTGIQPIQGSRSAWMVHNGEIYNFRDLKKNELKEHSFRTTGDSEVIVHLYEKYGYEFVDKLDGDFAFVVVDGDDFIAARDPIGVKPLYYGKDEEGALWFASEMKVLADQCVEFQAFPPGYYYTPVTGFVQYYKPAWYSEAECTKEAGLVKLRESLIDATRKRLMADVPLGVLLSGGLDSSLTSSIASRLLKEEGKELHSFSIGLDSEAPDLKAAKKVADFLGTIHHEIHFTIEEGIEIIKKLIWHLETYDVTSIRASTPMYFLSKAISEAGIKVVLSGEGADEIFGGYLYFKNAPSAVEFQKETIRRVQRLSTADCLRADKSTMAHGLEARVPFLDKEFLQTAMEITAIEKMPSTHGGVEKYILRKAFDTPEDPFLPAEVLWRQKEQFSDGVGYSWIDSLIEYAKAQVSDAEMQTAAVKYPVNTPATKEAYFYREIFAGFYPQESAARSVKRWVPKWQEDLDPSGRASSTHIAKKQFTPAAAEMKIVAI
ncbi:asparagine synthase B [Antarcticibacterium flavum]|uniref:asparagine synthase (glutamine-hydrolyzing) n=1 Tax=Antarcticibacterium flavum TaxID=2058175 RepID=A0A5B7X208_9FLAO|nr:MULTISPECIES: asparagine synthase B [Antarcticibacterium]MCM4161535.1 asparagine synthase B [Antarcticibacterium sp. W02-3]QCY69135.1 asparagine synthase B [Antarcticibacterium flavum]